MGQKAGKSCKYLGIRYDDGSTRQKTKKTGAIITYTCVGGKWIKSGEAGGKADERTFEDKIRGVGLGSQLFKNK